MTWIGQRAIQPDGLAQVIDGYGTGIDALVCRVHLLLYYAVTTLQELRLPTPLYILRLPETRRRQSHLAMKGMVVPGRQASQWC